MHLLVLLCVPVVTGAVGWWFGKNRVTRVEALIHLVGMSALMVAGYHFGRWSGVQDTEIWNGRISSKDSGSGSCCHSYDCNCRTTCTTNSDGTSDCTEVCDTCYEHSYDDWYSATTTNGEQVYYDGCNPPGSSAPTTWSSIRIGEPTAVEHRYTNYVLADPEAILPRDPELDRFAASLPVYPEVRGWDVRRVLFVGMHDPDPGLDAALDEVNADLGAAHQVNVIVVVTPEADTRWFDALVAAWLGGNKNDVVVVIGAPAFPAISWVRVAAWNIAGGAEDEFREGLAARVQSLGTFDGQQIVGIVRDEIPRTYRRRPFAELEYLMARARPTPRAMVLMVLGATLLSSFVHRLFWRNRHIDHGPSPREQVRRAWQRLRGR